MSQVPSAKKGNGDPSTKAVQTLHSRFSWEGGKCKRSQCVGRVTIGEHYRVAFDFTINEHHGNRWGNILHVGFKDGERIPGVWLHPGSTKLHVRVSDMDDGNRGYDPTTSCEIGETYHIEIHSEKGTVTFKLNGKTVSVQSDIIVLTNFEVPVFIGDPWYEPAIVTVKNLVIESSMPTLFIK